MANLFTSQECLNILAGKGDTIQENLMTLTGHTPTSASVVTPIAVKGGVIRNIDQATGDIAITADGWIEDIKYGLYLDRINTVCSAELDSAVTRTGKFTAKLSTGDITGRGYINSADSRATTFAGRQEKLIPLKANTTYRFECYTKTSNAAADSVFIRMFEYGATFSNRVLNTSSKLTGNNDWTKLTLTFTTAATTAYGVIELANEIQGNISDAWFDINSMTLEEVSTITNPLSYAVNFYPKGTAVSSTDNIDQSQVTADNNQPVGQVSTKYLGQQFTPTKKYLTSFVIRKDASTGTNIGNMKIAIQADNGSTAPSGTDLGTPVTVANADWEAITDNTDYTVTYPLTLTIGGTYWIVFTSSTADGGNYARVKTQGTAGYAGGVMKTSADAVTWSAASTEELYFKTLYSKNTTNMTVRTDTETLSVTAPTVEGWANGTVIDSAIEQPTFKGFTLNPGSNTFYLSSNGSPLADGATDESLQVTVSGLLGESSYDASVQDLANIWAETSNLSTQEAINVKAGTTGLDIQTALNTIVDAI
jgi:hypothetical protein